MIAAHGPLHPARRVKAIHDVEKLLVRAPGLDDALARRRVRRTAVRAGPRTVLRAADCAPAAVRPILRAKTACRRPAQSRAAASAAVPAASIIRPITADVRVRLSIPGTRDLDVGPLAVSDDQFRADAVEPGRAAPKYEVGSETAALDDQRDEIRQRAAIDGRWQER